jgi:hypothetical protein
MVVFHAHALARGRTKLQTRALLTDNGTRCDDLPSIKVMAEVLVVIYFPRKPLTMLLLLMLPKKKISVEMNV